MIGKRIYPGFDGLPLLKPGEYGRATDGTWFACTPSGMLGNLARHSVTEHGDHTITVSPSILVHQDTKPGAPAWHGYLERGVWRTC